MLPGPVLGAGSVGVCCWLGCCWRGFSAVTCVLALLRCCAAAGSGVRGCGDEVSGGVAGWRRGCGGVGLWRLVLLWWEVFARVGGSVAGLRCGGFQAQGEGVLVMLGGVCAVVGGAASCGGGRAALRGVVLRVGWGGCFGLSAWSSRPGGGYGGSGVPGRGTRRGPGRPGVGCARLWSCAGPGPFRYWLQCVRGMPCRCCCGVRRV